MDETAANGFTKEDATTEHDAVSNTIKTNEVFSKAKARAKVRKVKAKVKANMAKAKANIADLAAEAADVTAEVKAKVADITAKEDSKEKEVTKAKEKVNMAEKAKERAKEKENTAVGYSIPKEKAKRAKEKERKAKAEEKDEAKVRANVKARKVKAKAKMMINTAMQDQPTLSAPTRAAGNHNDRGRAIRPKEHGDVQTLKIFSHDGVQPPMDNPTRILVEDTSEDNAPMGETATTFTHHGARNGLTTTADTEINAITPT